MPSKALSSAVRDTVPTTGNTMKRSASVGALPLYRENHRLAKGLTRPNNRALFLRFRDETHPESKVRADRDVRMRQRQVSPVPGAQTTPALSCAGLGRSPSQSLATALSAFGGSQVPRRLSLTWSSVPPGGGSLPTPVPRATVSSSSAAMAAPSVLSTPMAATFSSIPLHHGTPPPSGTSTPLYQPISGTSTPLYQHVLPRHEHSDVKASSSISSHAVAGGALPSVRSSVQAGISTPMPFLLGVQSSACGQRHAQKAPAPRPRRILCYGDSLTVGYCDGGQNFEPYGRMLSEGLAQSGVLCEVTVRGVSGCTAREMAKKMDVEITNERGASCAGLRVLLQTEAPFDLVIIMAGTNDLGLGESAKSILEHVSRLHEVCHMHDTPTVVMAPTTVPSGAPRVGRDQLAALLSRWAQSKPGVKVFIDSEEIVPRKTRSHHYDADQLHFSAAGSRALGQRLVPWIYPFVCADAPAC